MILFLISNAISGFTRSLTIVLSEWHPGFTEENLIRWFNKGGIFQDSTRKLHKVPILSFNVDIKREDINIMKISGNFFSSWLNILIFFICVAFFILDLRQPEVTKRLFLFAKAFIEHSSSFLLKFTTKETVHYFDWVFKAKFIFYSHRCFLDWLTQN